ncbi:hypothetical protein JOM56_000516 [Amanita muscaria]
MSTYPDAENCSHDEMKIILQRVKLLLDNFPDQLPEKPAQKSKFADFLNFTLDPDLLEMTGSEVSTLSEHLKRVFGWDARTRGDGIVPFMERGIAVRALHPVFADFLTRYPEDNVLKKWIIDVLKGAEKVYLELGVPVRESTTGIPRSVANKVTEIYNTCYAEFFQNELYFAAFLLDPRYDRKAFLKRSQISLFIPSEAARHAGRSPDVLVQEQTQDVLLKFLCAMLRPMLERIEQAPNDESIGHPLLRRKGIAKCVQDLSAQLLSVRIFSVLVNSMPDERTNSTITWLNSPVRGNQQSRSIINMIQVGQWYGKHVKDEPKASRSQARPAVKFRVIDKSVLERIQTRSEEEYATEEGDGSDSNEEENSVTVPAESSRTTDDSLPLPLPVAFKVNPHIDLKSAALRDMISEEPIVQAHATVRISEMAPESDGATVTVEQAFAEW